MWSGRNCSVSISSNFTATIRLKAISKQINKADIWLYKQEAKPQITEIQLEVTKVLKEYPYVCVCSANSPICLTLLLFLSARRFVHLFIFCFGLCTQIKTNAELKSATARPREQTDATEVRNNHLFAYSNLPCESFDASYSEVREGIFEFLINSLSEESLRATRVDMFIYSKDDYIYMMHEETGDL